MPSETTRPQDETRTINVTGQRLRVAIRPGDGTRTPLLLINGIGVNLEVLQQFVDTLDPAIEVIRFDVPGTGDSPVPLIPYRFSGLAWLVTKMLDQLGYQQIDVLGVSWGGALAQQFAFQYLIRCRRLILVSTGTGGFMVPGNPAALAKIATPRRYLDPAYMAQIPGEIYGGKMRTRPELAHEFARTARLGSGLGYFYQMLGGAGWSSIFWLHKLRQPTLILHGDDDPLVPLVNAKIMHGLIPHSKLYIFHDGHLGLGTSAWEITQVVEKFLTAPCAGYVVHPFPKKTVFTLDFRRCDPLFPAFLPRSRSLQDGDGCLDHDGFSVCSPIAIRLLSGCGRLSPAMLLSISEAVFRCTGHSTFDIRS